MAVRALLLGACVVACAHAWGALFNRFSPEMLNMAAYSDHGSFRRYPVGDEVYEESVEGNRLDDVLEEAAECFGAPCWDNAACCTMFTCHNPNSEEFGRCMPTTYGRKMGELCAKDNQCDAGLLCEEVVAGEPRVCRPPGGGRKQYNQECSVSSECDITRGLCCTLLRRHRQKPRKACAYFKDPLVCIGPVAMDQIQEHIEHTAGEKRIGFYNRFH